MRKQKVAAVAITILSCGQLSDSGDVETRRVGDDPKLFDVEAHAAPGTGGTGGADTIIPENPSRVVLRIEKEQLENVASILLTKFSGEEFLYKHEVVRDEAGLVIITYIPQGELTQMALVAFDENDKPIGEATRLKLVPEVKQGTKTIELWGSEQTVHFPADVEKKLTEGETILSGPITLQYLDTDRKVLCGRFKAPVDGTYQFKCAGSSRVFCMLNGVLTCHEGDGPFSIPLLAGQELVILPEPIPPKTEVGVKLDSLPPEE